MHHFSGWLPTLAPFSPGVPASPRWPYERYTTKDTLTQGYLRLFIYSLLTLKLTLGPIGPGGPSGPCIPGNPMLP